MTTNIGLNDDQRSGVIQILATLLADEHVLYIKTRNYHWNVTGPQFNGLHKFFESQYDQIEEFIDDIAERIRSLGGQTPATMTEFLKLARIKEVPGEKPNARSMVMGLATDNESIIRSLRTDLVTCGEKHGDAVTNDFLTGLLESHEKMAWMLRAFIDE